MRTAVLVDDNAIELTIAKDLLEGMGYHIKTASNGREALAFVRKQAPALIISDISMPGMSGFDLLDALRAEGKLPPFIIASSHNDASHAIMAIDKGAHAYVTKPLTAENLGKAVDDAIFRHRQVEETTQRQARLAELEKMASGIGEASPSIRVAIADDHAIVRAGLREILSAEPGIEVSAEAGSGQAIIETARRQALNVVLLDISMPGKNVLDTLKQLRIENPALPVLILSARPEDQFSLRLIKAGAAGYVTKGCPPEVLISAIRKVCSGGKYIGPELAEIIASNMDGGNETTQHEKLSDREYEVFMLLAKGKSISKIAEELYLSSQTISTFRARILDKMGMKTNADLIRYALENQLID
jgi:DNA-binding NarL/FixJ family response regulator